MKADVMTQQDWITRAQKVMPAGGLGNFDPSIFIKDGKGTKVRDENNNEYIDYLIGSGPMVLGHGNEEVMAAINEQLAKGMTFFANNSAAVELAEVIVDAMACADQLRFLTNGGDADMYAIRVARAYTGRDKILKFEGGYHGMSPEAQMSLEPSKLVNFPNAVPDSAGIPEGVRQLMLIAPFNDLEATHSLIQEHAKDIAAIIVEPLQRIIPPAPGFLEMLREECDANGIVLIFDEVVTGFRLAYGGAQEAYGVVPDLCTLGKIIGGGFPLAALAGKEEIMQHFDKAKAGDDGFLMLHGTLSGNPVAAVAGMKTLEILQRPGQYETLVSIGNRLMNGISEILDNAGHAHQIVGHPTLFDAVFTDEKIENYRNVFAADHKKNAIFNRHLRERGIFKSPGKMYMSLAISDEDIEFTLNAYREAAALLET